MSDNRALAQAIYDALSKESSASMLAIERALDAVLIKDDGVIGVRVKREPYTCERIICAAVKCYEEVYCGYRHANIYNQFPILSLACPDSDEGFITTDNGRFVTRQEAWIIADNAGQIINKGEGIDGVLFSENLY
jgi:hypothetical protein